MQTEQRRHLVDVVRHAARRRHGVDERAVLGAIGPHVDQPLDAPRQEASLRIERQRAGQHRAAALVIVGEAFGAAADPFDRPRHRPRRQQHRHVFRIDFVAHSEAAADIAGVNPKAVRRKPGDMRERGLDVGHALILHVDVEAVGRLVMGNRARLGLHRGARNALRIEGERHRVDGLGERRLGRGLIAIAEFEHDVARYRIVKLHGVRRDRLRRRGHDRQVLVIDLDQFARVLRDRLGFGDRERHRLADETDAALRQGWPIRLAKGRALVSGPGAVRRQRLVAGVRQIFAGQHRKHAGQSPRRAGIDRPDARVGAVRPQERCVDLVRQIPVRGEATRAGQQPAIFATAFDA